MKTNVRICAWIYDQLRKHTDGLTIKDLQDNWSMFHSENEPLPRTSIQHYIDSIETMFDATIETIHDGRQNRYKLIKNQWADDSFKLFLNSLALANVKDLSERIVIETIPSGAEYLADIISAMRNSFRLEIDYQPFFKSFASTYKGKPLGLKLHQRRWYLLGEWDNQGLRNYPLDRVKGLRLLPNESFEYDDNSQSPMSFYRNCIGTWVQGEPTNVTIRAFGDVANDLAALPLHETQEIADQNSDYTDFTLNVCLTHELVLTLLSKGSHIQVLQPKELREMMKAEVEKMREIYE